MNSLLEWLTRTDYLLIDALTLTLLIFTAFAAIRMRDLLASAILLGIFSLLMALIYLLLDAPDVALTEAAVGAGISTILFLLTLSFAPRHETPMPPTQSTVALLVVIIMGATLLYTAEGLPPFASPDAPAHNHLAPYYIENMKDDIDIPNLVTAILASYRGFDTMGEVAVIFMAGVGMASLLMNLPQRRGTPEPKPETAASNATPKTKQKNTKKRKAAPRKTVRKKGAAS